MDPALLKERDDFRKRAHANPTVSSVSTKQVTPKKPIAKKPKTSGITSSNYKTLAGSSQVRFSVLAKIINYMKKRHQDGDDHALDVDEILDETNQLDLAQTHKQWLSQEALPNNPKISVIDGYKYAYKAKYPHLVDRKALLKQLEKNYKRGLGGLLMDDIEESLPHAAKCVKSLRDYVLVTVRPQDKKEVVFYNDKSTLLEIEPDLKKLWNSVSVEEMDDKKITEYLEKQGITTMEDVIVKKESKASTRKKAVRKSRNFKKMNEHMSSILTDYRPS